MRAVISEITEHLSKPGAQAVDTRKPVVFLLMT